MGGLLAFRVGNYTNTAEREQFRFLCNQLKSHYENSGEYCVFVGNFNIGCELDALFIKSDAIISIEFKNYGGHVVSNENGEWTCNDTVIKGGSRKTVLQQARINHSIVKKELKALGLDAKQVKDVPHLIVFHQPITLNNQLSYTNKSWLHITDNAHFIEKIDDITSPNTELPPLSILKITKLLNLIPFFLDDFSSASFNTLEDECKELKESIEENKCSISNNGNHPLSSIFSERAQIAHDKYSKEEIELLQFIQNALSIVLKKFQYEIVLFDSSTFDATIWADITTCSTQYIVAVTGMDIEKYAQKISTFLYRNVKIHNSDLIYWEEGQILSSSSIKEESNQNDFQVNRINNSEQHHTDVIKFRKSKTILPHWLDRFLFDDFKAKYAPEHTRFEYNLNLTDSEIKIYLGTYFPRSYAETFCIYENLFTHQSLYQKLESLSEIRILDVGCGTGGEIIGLIIALSKHFPNHLLISIDACDGNELALTNLKEIVDAIKSHTHHVIKLNLHHKTYLHKTKVDTRDFSENHYEFILCNKFVCELLSQSIIKDNAYKKVAKSLCPLLSENGIFLLLDVTTKDINTGLFYPQLMNSELNSFVKEHKEYATLLPLACSNFNCNEQCFIQQTFTVCHSRISCDDSRVCYRLLCHRKFKDEVFPVQLNNVQHIIHPLKFIDGDKSGLCKKSYGDKIIDTFNINQ